ncbi:hypothetical protein Zmor_019467 [Zophobas morio]|uniref:Uncharacterized protein n=1 Tax=Zophobas morio TaxID=2755281 RepID=A0AA38I1R6_9CUCU|nr:hypothetical protein Zmor_019467 [Zophobas morio]
MDWKPLLLDMKNKSVWSNNNKRGRKTNSVGFISRWRSGRRSLIGVYRYVKSVRLPMRVNQGVTTSPKTISNESQSVLVVQTPFSVIRYRAQCTRYNPSRYAKRTSRTSSSVYFPITRMAKCHR